jgi:hypothetical protein
MKIVFIASLSHSGSTLLDLLLNAHPQVVSVGELKQLSRYARFQKRRVLQKCTCGANSLWECPFWSRVNALTQQATGQTIGELNVEEYGELESFQRDNVALFEAIAATSGKKYIVDSSKSRSRLKLLMENPELEVLPVFLVRNPKGQICSVLRKSENSKSTIYDFIADYVNINRGIYSIIKNRQHVVVSYEKLVRSPERTLQMLMESIGLTFDPRQLDWAARERHNIGGNGVRRRTRSDIKLDDRWRQQLSLSQKLAIDLGTLAGRYGVLKFDPRCGSD